MQLETVVRYNKTNVSRLNYVLDKKEGPQQPKPCASACSAPCSDVQSKSTFHARDNDVNFSKE
ncbi:hypothetical protein NQ317_011883 [Molorchus minor]|uniref:Uncharacterized protein n=1 Tax=Molorchus minor TaxID=1323400 RepID=A0ABQ9JTI2_9CUCU|nr:hypothetical protein NQ317_011883 [Molorchus minor]